MIIFPKYPRYYLYAHSSNIRGREIKFLFTFGSNYWQILHIIQRKITGECLHGNLAVFFFNIIDLNVFFCFIHMRIWDIRDLTNFRSIRRRSHCEETLFNSNWLCRRFCFFFILNKFIRESGGREFWIKNFLWCWRCYPKFYYYPCQSF